MYDEILYDVDEPVATVTLNRPDRLNAWTDRMASEVKHALAQAESDSRVVVILLTGAGRGFCAGVDLDELRAQQSGASSGGGTRLGEEAFLRSFPLELSREAKPRLRDLGDL